MLCSISPDFGVVCHGQRLKRRHVITIFGNGLEINWTVMNQMSIFVEEGYDWDHYLTVHHHPCA